MDPRRDVDAALLLERPRGEIVGEDGRGADEDVVGNRDLRPDVDVRLERDAVADLSPTEDSAVVAERRTLADDRSIVDLAVVPDLRTRADGRSRTDLGRRVVEETTRILQ